MADIRDVIDKAVELAEAGASVFPMLGTGAALAEKVLDIVDSLKTEAPDNDSEVDLEDAHAQLYETMTSKGHALSDRLRG
jgi:hypothetical protein